MQQTGKILIVAGIILVIAGLVIYFAGNKLNWLGHLPGDIRIEKENVRFYNNDPDKCCFITDPVSDKKNILIPEMNTNLLTLICTVSYNLIPTTFILCNFVTE